MSNATEVNIGKQGRLVIPAGLRRSLGLSEGDRLIAREEDGRLVFEKPESIHQQLQAMFTHVPDKRSLADELIAERREAAKKESEE